MKKLSVLQIVRAAICADSTGKNKDGNIVVRQGYFYRHGKTADALEAQVRAGLSKRNDIEFKILGSGDHWAPFRGGASLVNQSHWWVVVRVIHKTDQEAK